MGHATGVINGHDVDHSSSDASAPLVALQMSENQPDESTRYYRGTAFLIGPNLLLTAGHNVAYIPDPNNVEAIFASAPCWGPNVCQERRIRATITKVHPLFRQISGGTEYDIAFVKLASNAPEDYRVMPLADRSTGITADTIRVFGFVTDREDIDAIRSVLRLRSISLTPVNSSYRLGSGQKFWLDQSRAGICGGDSGGPAVVHQPSFQAIGLAIHVTYRDGVSHCLTQAAFTDVLFFRDWIVETIANLH